MHAYASVGIETGVRGAGPHQLVLMLYDGALRALADARRALARGDVPAKAQALARALRIVDEGLKASLDTSVAGELPARLASLYEYMGARILHANLHNEAEPIDEVGRLLAALRSAWAGIAGAAAFTAPAALTGTHR